MAWYNDVWKIINKAATATARDADGCTVVNDRSWFKELPLSGQSRVNDLIEEQQKKNVIKFFGRTPDSLASVQERSGKLVPCMLNNYKTSTPLTVSVRDAIMNFPTMTGVPHQDPAMMNYAMPNIWLSPQEASAIYSQKGIPEVIIRKKSQSILLNGVKIKNPRLEPAQLDAVHEDIVRNGLANKIADAVRDSLVYGGALLFPMFKKDTPVSMNLPVTTLMKYGIVGKGCIDWVVGIDRWNTVHVPNWNPTAKDFLYPKRYYVPFLGCDVSGERCARIVTAPQAGYWGTLMTMGWGISDIPGWIESVYNYYNVMQAIPTMIAQMSILARTFNVDGVLAQEGESILDEAANQNTIRVREMSVNDPISLDVIGNIQAIQRDFKEVPNLVRLIRQDAAARAGIPEELFWSSERGAFSSGDTTEGALEKQWESVKYIHRDAAFQLKNIAMLEIINALGLDRKVLAALPYTTIEFDNPIVANAEVRSKIATNLGKTGFDLTSAGFPMDAVAQIISSYGDDEFSVRSDLVDALKKRQAEIDEKAAEKHEKEIELLQAQIDLTNEQVKHVGENTGMSNNSGKNLKQSSRGYSRLEQHQHEKTRGTTARREGLQKAEGRKVNSS